MRRRPLSVRSYRNGVLSVCALVAAAAGCSSETGSASGAGRNGASGEGSTTSAPDPEADASRLTIGSLCPSCQPSDAELLAGGESSDFEGGIDGCAAFVRHRMVTLEEAKAEGFDIERVRALVEREFSAPLRWAENAADFLQLAPPAAMPPSGFVTETSIHGVVRAASELAIAELDPALCDSAGVCSFSSDYRGSCASYIAGIRSTLDLTLELQTADAAIECTTLSGRVWLSRGEAPVALDAGFGVDLALVRGTLRLGSGLPEPHSGSLLASISFWPTAVRGALTPVFLPIVPVYITGNGEARPIAPVWRYAPLGARWPGDVCDSSELPVDSETAEGRAALERWASEYPAAEARVSGAPLFDATWFDVPGTSDSHLARVGVELIGEPRSFCVNSLGEPNSEVDVHVWSEDGTLDWTLPVRAELRRRPEQVPSLRLFRAEQFASGASFWSTNLERVDLLGAPGAEVSLAVGYGLDESNFIDLRLQVQAVPGCDRDYRCPALDAPETLPCESCGTPAVVMRAGWSR